MSTLLVQAAAALAVVGALLYARRRLAVARSGIAAPSLEVRARQSLGRESGVAVVSWDGREILVGYGASGVTGLLASEDAEAVLP
jgi:flagellar biogenesis protein FliO